MKPGFSKLLFIAASIAVIALTMILSTRGHRRRQGFAFVLAWVVPGAGHAALGLWGKALFFFGILAATYAGGLWLSGWHTVAFDDNPFYYVGQFGSGLTMLLGHVLGTPKAFPRDDIPKAWYDPGLLYVCVVGLLNLVIMLSVLDVKGADEKSAEPRPPQPAAAQPQPPAAAPAPEGK